MDKDLVYYLLKIFQAIAISDCSKNSQDLIFTHEQITDFAELIGIIFPNSNIFKVSTSGEIMLIECYLKLLGARSIGANARSEIALRIINILAKNDDNFKRRKQIEAAIIDD